VKSREQSINSDDGSIGGDHEIRPAAAGMRAALVGHRLERTHHGCPDCDHAIAAGVGVVHELGRLA
jgi:hypothetical protein